ncbi:HEAT repeat-containing protein [Xenococcus sp. PCC 7305]|uniref:HEAT repeat domain-containing protein n=1 Tax=Xenococcus sp. PCC 7305 TaxID=102125 RepID=UPI0002ACC46B|nr:HEAT repeat domain-containing protein [Xenococcus sp. PCC 7305]ELS00644.1 HEAT repeat-containing protein [Xenococcus sp. PCC 7305]
MDNNDLSLLDGEAGLDNPQKNNNSSSTDLNIAPTAPEDIEKMLGLLTHPEASKRMLAARVFCELSDSRSIPFLINLLDDICPLVRVSATYALGRNTSPEAVGPLIDLLGQDWNGYVRKGVVWALGNSSDRRSLQPLIHALKTDISAVRLWAASGLAQIAILAYEDMIAAVPPLIQGLRRDSVSAVRSNCAWAIGKVCRELPSNVIYATAIDALIESLVEDEDLGVKDDARAAILRVGDSRGLQTIEDLEFEGVI